MNRDRTAVYNARGVFRAAGGAERAGAGNVCAGAACINRQRGFVTNRHAVAARICNRQRCAVAENQLRVAGDGNRRVTGARAGNLHVAADHVPAVAPRCGVGVDDGVGIAGLHRLVLIEIGNGLESGRRRVAEINVLIFKQHLYHINGDIIFFCFALKLILRPRFGYIDIFQSSSVKIY